MAKFVRFPRFLERSRDSCVAFPTLRPRVRACVRVRWLLLSAAAASLFKFIQPWLSASCAGVREAEPDTKTAGLVCFECVCAF